MAFDMIVGKERTYIETDEEVLFLITQGDKNYPQLNRLWESYYESPKIYPDIANTLVYELEQLKSNLFDAENRKTVETVINRIVPFLERAFENHAVINCKSD